MIEGLQVDFDLADWENRCVDPASFTQEIFRVEIRGQRGRKTT